LALYKFADDCQTVMNVQHQQSGQADVFSQLQLGPLFKRILTENGEQYSVAENITTLLTIVLRHHQRIVDAPLDASSLVETLFGDYDTANFIGVNQYQDVWYFNKEQFETVIRWYLAVHVTYHPMVEEQSALAIKTVDILHKISNASIASGYQIEKLKELVVESADGQKILQKKVTKKGNSVKSPVKKKATGKKSTAVRKKTSSENVKNITKRKSSR
jgi:hypothetical protein